MNKLVKEKLEKHKRIERLALRLEVDGDCVFSNKGNAVKIEESVENDYNYEIYDDSGDELDGGVFDGSEYDCVKFVLNNHS
jgi:hypothetical protein